MTCKSRRNILGGKIVWLWTDGMQVDWLDFLTVGSCYINITWQSCDVIFTLLIGLQFISVGDCDVNIMWQSCDVVNLLLAMCLYLPFFKKMGRIWNLVLHVIRSHSSPCNIWLMINQHFLVYGSSWVFLPKALKYC